MISVNAKKTIAQLDLFIDNLEGIIDDALNEIAEGVRFTAAKKTKGNLAKSIKIEKSNETERRVFADQPYAEFVENGRKAIKAKDNEWLHFYVNGKSIYTKQVKAVRAKPFMEPSRVLYEKRSPKIVEKHLKLFLRHALAFA